MKSIIALMFMMISAAAFAQLSMASGRKVFLGDVHPRS
jgi:hypothetical protein